MKERRTRLPVTIAVPPVQELAPAPEIRAAAVVRVVRGVRAALGRKVVIVANLAPRKLRGIESQGMIVAASLGEEGQPALASFLEAVPNGARLK